MLREAGRSDSEADCSGAGVKALVPHRDRKVSGAERKCTGEMNGVSPAKLMSGCERTGDTLDVG